MTEKEPPAGEKDAETMGADDPYDLKGLLKRLGGSQSDHWNKVLIDQTVHTLGLNRSDGEARERRHRAALAGLIGIGPQDEMEGMIAAQLIATHNATMECYRRAMIAEQTLEGRRENLNQANKLARTYATLIEALNRHRGKGQQKVTVEHVHVHAGGQAVVGMVEAPGGGDASEIRGTTPCEANCPCTAARDAEPGQGAGARAGRQRCRTAVAECMAGCPQAPQRVTRTPSSTDTIRLKPSPAGARLRTCCGRRGLL